jgi:hypothetical protein
MKKIPSEKRYNERKSMILKIHIEFIDLPVTHLSNVFVTYMNLKPAGDIFNTVSFDCCGCSGEESSE